MIGNANINKFRAIDAAVGRQGFKIVLLTRLSPLFPFNLLNFAFGLTSVSLLPYVVASWIGMLPGTLMYVYLGSAAKSLAELATGRVEGGWGQRTLFGVGLLVTVIVTVFVARVAGKALSEELAISGEQETARDASVTL
ncbi:MAG TPA: VTT domain-containing protein [Thermoguttaceae bacterium]|nr:VTT domain-containing protein [Thermoguttaceae bacterium]